MSGDQERAIPEWEDEYLDRVSDRLMVHYDLEKGYTVRGERFPLYGEMRMRSEKHFLHPALSYAQHELTEHLFVRRTDGVTVTALERLVELGHALADEWIEGHEDHYGTDFTFVLVADEVPPEVRTFVDGFRDRTLLKYGYYGQYEVNLGVVAPEHEDSVASQQADVVAAFRLWEPLEDEREGVLARLLG